MKSAIVFFFAVFATLPLFSQTWAPDGAVWHYSFVNPWIGHDEYNTIQVEGDSMISGINCQRLTKARSSANLRPREEYMYEDNGQVFYYEAGLDTFFLLYDFNLVAGDTFSTPITPYEYWIPGMEYIKMRVDSISTMDINGTARKVQHIIRYEIGGFNSQAPLTVIEGIGATSEMFYWRNQYIADASYNNGLRCYEDQSLGLYSTGLAFSCEDVLLNGGGSEDPIQPLAIYPNPATDRIGWDIPNGNYRARIWDMRGKIIVDQPVSGEGMSLVGFSNGLYFLEISDRVGQRYGSKFRRQSNK